MKSMGAKLRWVKSSEHFRFFKLSPAVNKASGEFRRQLGYNDNTVSLSLFAFEDVMLVLNIEP